MTFRRSFLLAVVACALWARAAPGASPAEPPTSDATALKGVPLEGLSPEQRQLLVDFAKSTFCYCGCPHTVAQCLREHGTCRHASRMATLAARLVRAGAKKDELARLVIVEFSDFTCPYCQLVRPVLESFVEGRKGRVKLIFKPFPIESHPGALEVAQAAEWARDQKLFWPMHDALFSSPGSHTPDELGALAREVGGDPESLRAALADGRYVPKIRGSQAEARAAGIKGTPTIFLNGRPLVLMDYSDEGLDFTLQDEEEWVQHRGWQRD